MGKLSAVLTGDFIGSTDVAPERLAHSMAVLAAEAGILGEAIGSDFRFTRFRGDGWQIHLADPRHFLGVTVYLNAVLRSDPVHCLNSRIAIGLGQTDSLGTTNLSDASGSAFVHSGRALDDTMLPGQIIALEGDGTNGIQRSAIAFVENLITNWSPEQAQVTKLDLSPGSVTQAEMATVLGISRQAVGARLQAAGGRLMRKALDAFFCHDWEKPNV
jgi:hypothetical protein